MHVQDTAYLMARNKLSTMYPLQIEEIFFILYAYKNISYVSGHSKLYPYIVNELLGCHRSILKKHTITVNLFSTKLLLICG